LASLRAIRAISAFSAVMTLAMVFLLVGGYYEYTPFEGWIKV
jgi:hypothetical protein